MRGIILIGALSLAATPASAQTVTDCRQNGSTWSCNSRPQVQAQMPNLPPPPSMNWGAIEAAMAARQARATQQQQYTPPPPPAPTYADPAQDAANYSRVVRQQVGEYLEKGDCETAKGLALRSGEIALANEVREYCAKP